MAPEPRAADVYSVTHTFEAPKEPQTGWSACSSPPWGRRLQSMYHNISVKQIQLYEQIHTKYMCQYIPNTTGAVMYWYWYVSWCVCKWKHANTDHNTYQYHRYISAADVKVNPYWYVFVYVFARFGMYLVCFGMYSKPLWHTGLRRAPVVLVRIVYVFARILVCIDPYIGSIHTKMTSILWICICSARIGLYWSCWYCLCTYWYQ